MRVRIKERRMWEEFKGTLLFSLFFHVLILAAVILWASRLPAHRWPASAVYSVNLIDALGPAEGKQSRKVKKARLAPPPVKKRAKEVKKEKSKPKEKQEKKSPPKETKKVALAQKEQKKEEKKKLEKPKEPAKKEESKVQKKAPAEKAPREEPQPAADPLILSRGGEGDGKSYRGSLFLDGWTNFPFTYYLVLIRNRIGDHWNPSLTHISSGNTPKVIIAFKVYRDGRISHPFIEETSGFPFLDETALRAVLSSAPFPPLPTGFKEEYLGVHFGFEYNYTG